MQQDMSACFIRKIKGEITMNDYYIHIDYPNGHMNLVLDEFFPCTIRAAKIMFPLINRYAAAAEKEKLRNHLTQYADKRKKELADMESDRLSGRRQSGKNYSHTNTVYKRALRNLQFLED